jgi:15-cis-phytoene synthase
MPPSWSEPGYTEPGDLAACRAAIRTGSKSFHAASILLPTRVADAALALYAFCREADDAIDGGTGSVSDIEVRLYRIYAGRPLPYAADRAFADVAARYGIPRALPAALLEGFAWDAEGRRYDSLSDLTGYAARVAGTVGAMMALLMGVRAPAALARACDLGVAMQFTNIARDVGEDARLGRLYLPREWLAGAGLDVDQWLAEPRPSPVVQAAVRRLLGEADRLYTRAEGGIAALPPGCRPAILAARLLYAEIGRVVAGGIDPVERRAVVRRRRKLALLAQAAASALTLKEGRPEPPLPETRFLVEAMLAGPVPHGLDARAATAGPLDRTGFVLELFARLERRAA